MWEGKFSDRWREKSFKLINKHFTRGVVEGKLM